ncbi:ubiquitin-conjugating enzyme E2 32-like [Zingiber officinale]|uniref:ubiquitin-conjugating enzyme E2 32-like n=1 Tax=Zingiber officinale TaxID=94328 RepID=UPI001C4ABC4F|nr:ubiquitin-conjugating enzyme E2 32-like [Zingiber officinale]
MAEDRYNRRNPAVKRILQEVKEMQANPSDDFLSLPLEDNIFEWQFAILGPRDTEFEGGIYHGRIQLPAEYPFKPPSFMFLTPNGRFETQTKICLSISNYHPEHWQPSWSVRTALVALIAFMSTNPNGALGSLDCNKEVRRELAIKSRETAPTYGNSERQMLIDEIHQYLLNKSPPVPQLLPNPTTESSDSAVGEIDAISATEDLLNQQIEDRVVEAENETGAAADAGRRSVSSTTEMKSGTPTVEVGEQHQRPRVQQSFQDRALTWAAIWLAIAILILLMKKFLKSKIVAESISDL